MRLCVLTRSLLFLCLALPGLVFGQSPGRERPPAWVEVETVGKAEVAPTAELLGTVEAYRVSLVAAWIDGYVIECAVREGDFVKKGDVLVRLSDEILRLELDVAQSSLAEMRELLEKGTLDLKRARELLREDAVSQEDLDEAVTQESILRLRVVQQEGRIRVLQRKILRKTVLAPFAGQIVREHTQLGEWVRLGAPVVRLVDLTRVYVRVNVPERQLRFLATGREATVRVPAAAAAPYRGRLLAVGGEGDYGARTFPVRIELQNDGRLRAGMSARAELPIADSRSALLLSKDAVLLKERQSYVFVVEDGAAVVRAIETGIASGGRLEVLSGLDVGVPVVVKGNERLASGARVRIRPSTEPAADSVPASASTAVPGSPTGSLGSGSTRGSGAPRASTSAQAESR
jgi:membrane fusion protein (multidrug efflux system)